MLDLDSATRREQTDLRLLRRYHEHNDAAAREEMVRRGQALVKSLARHYSGRGERFDDLVQVGSVGLVKAIDRFDPDAGTRFVAFAAPNITGEIKRHFRDHCWLLHVPRSVQELDAKINRETERFVSEVGRRPTVQELADALDEPEDRIVDALQGGRGYSGLSLDSPVGDTVGVLDMLGEEDPQLAAIDERDLVRRACATLDERERRIVALRYSEGLLQREIADRFGISQMQVSRILARALARMREFLLTQKDVEQDYELDRDPREAAAVPRRFN
ncbi:MAG: SigB/SigF/SigG family RNA polymerase sigma factor [Patulibacter sp.]|nr:SigB/SigF/SigG family RNA polymerase sigma factor [Patulibacter sp.]